MRGAGRAYIYYGGLLWIIQLMLYYLVRWVMNLAFPFPSAGDVNGDGYSDVIVGAYRYDAGGTEVGRAFIYYGGTGMDNSADVILTGASASDYDRLGWSVSTAGDVNGDGLDDVIVGAPQNLSPGTGTGRAYLYLSSAPAVKPRILSVNDVPLDQGGFVRVRWARSGYDISGQNRLGEYILQRSDPPGLSGFVWDYVATIPALRQSEYSFVCTTPSDSFSNSSGTFYFRIIARGISPDEMWYSNIIYGHSTDNLAPSPPLAFYAQQNGTDVKLGWQANSEKDFRDYYIYRSDTALTENIPLEGREKGSSIPQESIILLGTTTDTIFTDPAPLSGNCILLHKRL